MEQSPKKRKVGRPRLPKHETKGHIVPVRFRPDELKRIVAIAKANRQTVSEWIRLTLAAALNQRWAN